MKSFRPARNASASATRNSGHLCRPFLCDQGGISAGYFSATRAALRGLSERSARRLKGAGGGLKGEARG